MADTQSQTPSPAFSFETHPSRYQHYRLRVEGPIARLVLMVKEDAPHRSGYTLKLNSYDLGVDIELADAVQRLRFEHPEVRCVVITSERDRIFCAGANIPMLATSTHAFKVNFCKFTNETRLAIEDASARSGQRYLCAANGTTAGGGYELALACDEILLIDDGNSAVSLPEVPLLGVLPGTGGLTRVVDKRKVRRDRADLFCTLAEGIKGRRAVEWGLVDAVAPRSKFAEATLERAKKLAAAAPPPPQPTALPGVVLGPLEPKIADGGRSITYRHVELRVDAAHRTADLTVHAPGSGPPDSYAAFRALGDAAWPLRAFRELDDALLRLRFHCEEVGLLVLRTRGDADKVLAWDRELAKYASQDWLSREIVLHMARVLRRLDLTARSQFAVLDPGSCFAGSLLELALAADRTYMLDDTNRPVHVQVGPLSGGALPMSNGLTRLQVRFLANPANAAELVANGARMDAEAADQAGLVTVLADDLDFDDTLRLAIEERASLSPDSLTGMEASLRFPGPETLETKIFGRLSAWQNWIFIRPNATGEKGALSLYGKPERPAFDWRRT